MGQKVQPFSFRSQKQLQDADYSKSVWDNCYTRGFFKSQDKNTLVYKDLFEKDLKKILFK